MVNNRHLPSQNLTKMAPSAVARPLPIQAFSNEGRKWLPSKEPPHRRGNESKAWMCTYSKWEKYLPK